MTNKKLKMAAMSVALTACVAASPLAANADAPEAAPGEPKTEPVAEETETKKEENTAEPQVNQEAKDAQKTLKDAEVKYNKDNPKDNPTTNPDGFQKLDGVIVTNPNPDPNPNPGSGETNPNPDSGETNPNPDPDSGKTDPNPNPDPEGGKTDPEEKKPEEIKPEEKKPEEKKPEQIGTAEKTEKSETNVETKPNPGAEPIVDTTTPPTVEKNPDGSTTITQPTVTPGKETTTTTGSGTATGNLNEKEEEVKEIDLDKELGENPDISWDIKPGAEAVAGKDYKVEEVTNSPDGNQQTLKLKKEKETTAEMTAEDIAKLVDAEKPTLNADGSYTLTRTEKYLDEKGNEQTRTTYITIRDSKVTTKTTTELTITREKIEHNEEANIPTDVVLPDVKLNNNETLSHTKLDEMLKEKGGKDANGVKDGEYTYKETAEDGTVREYTIKIDTTSTDQLTNKEIVDKLNDKLNSDRYSAEGEDKVITYLKTSVTHADMTTEQLIKALNDQKKLAQKTYVKVNEGNEYEETLKNYYSGKGDFYHTYAPYGGFLGTAKGDYIGHLDLASGAKLDLLPGEDGKSQTTDCVLVNPKLEWNDSAEHLLADQSKLDKKDRNHDAGLDGKVSYDKSGHYEYDRGDNNHPNASAFYKVTGTVAYDAVKDEKGEVKRFEGKDAEKDAVNAYLKAVESDKTYDTLTEKEKQKILSTYVVKLGSSGSNPNSPKGYQVYKKSSTMTAYGYMTRDANVCANATASKGSLTGWYAGGYDLKISKLVQVRDGQVVGENQSSIKTLFAPVSVRSSSTKTNSSMTVGTKTTSTPVEEWATAGYGTQTDGEYKYDVDREKERSLWQFGYSDGSYKSFTNLIQNIFKGEDTGTVEGGFIKYEYHTEKNKDGTPVKFEADKMVVTTKQDAEVHYTFTSQESRDVWIKGYTQTVVPPVNPGPDSPELPPVEDAKPAPAPAPAPEAPVLPVVQDARPDPAPAPAPAPAPETPVLPAVQDAKLIQTGTSGWLADLMLGAGMVLSAAGYWMERKRKAMFYKSQH